MLRFVHLSDTHLSPDPDYTYKNADYPALPGAKALVQAVNALPFTPDFILHTGDAAYDPDPAAYPVVKSVLGELKAPVYYLAGNHDDGAILIQTMMGQSDLFYAFDSNGVQIICLDSNGGGVTPPAGRITDEQFDWLAEICRVDDPRPLIVAVHHNPLPAGVPWLDDYMSLVNGERLHQALLPLRERLRGVFHGHIHMNTDILRDGILYTSAASSWYQLHAYPDQNETIADRGAEPGFTLVTVTQTQTFMRRHRFPRP